MSLDEASACAGRVVTLYGQVARLQDDAEVALPLVEDNETRVPPFLVKSV